MKDWKWPISIPSQKDFFKKYTKKEGDIISDESFYSHEYYNNYKICMLTI